MIKKKVNYTLTPFWKEVETIVNDPHYKGDHVKASYDYVLNKKINTFLYRGPAGTFYEIKQALGQTALNEFLNYLRFYLKNVDHPGHYYPSELVKKQIKEIRQNNNLFDLTKTLNQISRIEYEKHGDKKSKGWMPNENSR